MASTNIEGFVTLEEFRAMVRKVVDQHGLLLIAAEIGRGKPMHRIKPEEIPDAQLYVKAVASWPADPAFDPIDKPNRWGAVNLRHPESHWGYLAPASIGAKSDWWDGTHVYENPISMEIVKPFKYAFRKLLTMNVRAVFDDGGEYANYRMRCSAGVEQWVRNGGTLRESSNASFYCVPETLYNESNKER